VETTTEVRTNKDSEEVGNLKKYKVASRTQLESWSPLLPVSK
jgi:hypothetical protein